MSGKNEIRSTIREKSTVNEAVLASLQCCKIKDNMAILDGKISKVTRGSTLYQHLSGLRAVLYSLLALIPDEDGTVKRQTYLGFDEAYLLFLAFVPFGSLLIDDREKKKYFKELLLHPEYGLSVYIVKTKFHHFIILKSGETDLADFLLKVTAQNQMNETRFEMNKQTIQQLMKTVDTEWDRKVVRIIIGATRSRSEIESLGIDPDSLCKDEKDVFGLINLNDEIEDEANKTVIDNLQNLIDKKKEDLSQQKRLLQEKENLWQQHQVDDMKEVIEETEATINNHVVLKEVRHGPKWARKVNRCKKKIIRERRLKLRKLGSGRRRAMDETDESFLVDCIMSKATAHGRRQDSVLYLNHRVKKKDFLKIVNFSHRQRGLPFIRSATTAFNRSVPKSKRSIQSKNHIGLGLFCSKKPPKAEDNSNILTHFCRAHKKNIIRQICMYENKDSNLFRSMDDKAYLCPNTSTGVQSLRSQTLFQVNDENLARKLPKYDFPVTLVNCTPGTFLFMNKVSEIVNDKETIKTVDQQSVVVTKPKAFIGSSGTIWASNTMQIKHAEPSLYESEKHLPWQSKAYRSILLFIQDNLHYFLDQLVESDMLLVSGKPECIFRKYEMEKLQKLKNRILAVKERFTGNQGKFCEMETQILKSLSDELDNVSVKIDEILLHLVSGLAGADITVRDVADNILSCLVIIKDRSQIPKLKSRIIDLTDAGPGVGITNREVRFRTIQEVRIAQYDYYIRHHLAPGDSSQNEVERIQSYVGMYKREPKLQVHPKMMCTVLLFVQNQ